MNLRAGGLTLALLSGLAASAAAYAPLGYPGSTWGNLSRDLDGLEGNGTMGNIRQGVDWAKLPGGVTFNTFGAYRWRFRSEQRPYYNAAGPGVGFDFSRGPLAAGLDLSWVRYPELSRDTRDFLLYGSWYRRWDISRWTGKPYWGLRSALAVPFSTWGRVEYDIDGVEGAGSQGWVKQGIDWVKVQGVILNTFASYNWRLRSDNQKFYNAHGPAVGVQFDRGPLNLVLDYNWRSYPQLQEYTRTFGLTLTWYYGWDFKRR